MEDGDHQSTGLRCWGVGIQTMMINELGCCDAGVVLAYGVGEGHRVAAQEKLGKEGTKHKIMLKEVEHHGWLIQI